MSLLWRKTSLLNKDDVLRETATKNTLTQGLGVAVKALQEQHINSNEPIPSGDYSNNVCHYLEAIFIHGLKDTFFDKVSAILASSTDKTPEPNFWLFLLIFSHKDVISHINNLGQINTDIGRCRTWIRVALNEGLLESYMAAMVQDKATIEYYYKSTAYLRDAEQPDIMRKYVEGLGLFQFKLACNSHLLNMWTLTPLILSGVWSPPIAPEPVMTGIDVASCLDENDQPSTPDRKKKLRGRPPVDRERGPIDFIQKAVSEGGSETSSIASCPDPMPPLLELDYDEKLNLVLKIEGDIHTVNDLREVLTSNDISQHSSLSDLAGGVPIGHYQDDRSIVPTTSATEDSGLYLDDESKESQNAAVGNRLIGRTGWSSSFEEETQIKGKKQESLASEQDESFQSLLQNYSPIHSSIIRTPDFNDMLLSAAMTVLDEEFPKEQQTQTSPPSSSADETEFEILPKSCSITSSNAEQRTQELLAIIGTIRNEVGLDVQNYQCKACGRPIGMIYGKARVCAFDGYSYCFECHENDEYYIPARIVHNWDFKKYKVSKHTKAFLQQIEEEPLIDIRQTNPQLYAISDEMDELQRLRTQLSYLRSYLFSCRESVAEEMRRKLWPKEYLYEHIHLYSLLDLVQTPTRSLAQLLSKIIFTAKRHVNDCRLCMQKGFICEICNNSKVIFPFELESTYRCERCLAVYHSSCMRESKPCPKCERRKKRNDHEDFAWNVDD